MTRKNFLKTSIVGIIIGFFAPNLVAETQFKSKIFDKSFSKNCKKEPEQPMYLVKSSLACLDKINTSEDRHKIDEISNMFKLVPCDLMGTLDELILKQHKQMLSLMSRMIAEHDDNKHLNLDYSQLLREFMQKYKITNINT